MLVSQVATQSVRANQPGRPVTRKTLTGNVPLPAARRKARSVGKPNRRCSAFESISSPYRSSSRARCWLGSVGSFWPFMGGKVLLSLDMPRSRADDRPMETQPIGQLRSAKHRGRPAGSFGDPVARLRAWWWLSEILKAQEVSSVSALRSLKGIRARFVNHHQVITVLQEIELDGYGPGQSRDASPRIREVFEEVAKKPAYIAAPEAYNHPLWTYLSVRSFPSVSQQWRHQMLASYGLIRVEAGDESSGEKLGLIASERMHLDGSAESESRPLPFAGHSSFATLDGLLLLTMLMKEAEDEGVLGYVRVFRDALRDATRTISDSLFDWHAEARDTWKFIAETRLATWTPNREPSEEDKLEAWNSLAKAFDQRSSTGRAVAPSKLTRGRSERRWRRRAWAYAAARGPRGLPFDYSAYPTYFYTSREPHLEWLIDHREAIDSHIGHAIARLIVGDEEAVFLQRPLLKPLKMPRAVMDMRVRPTSYSEDEIVVFGDAKLYDVIEIEVE